MISSRSVTRRMTHVLGFLVLASYCAAAYSAPLGNTADGTTADSIGEVGGGGQTISYISATRFQATASATLGKIVAKVGASSGHYKCAIYSESGGTANTLLGSTTALGNVTTGWHDFSLTAPVSITTGAYYWLAIWSDDAAATVYETAGGTLRWSAYAYGAWPSPVSLSSGPAAASYCIYADAATTGPAIAVSGNSVSITDGDTSPDTADGTAAVIGATQSRTYTLANTGDASLTLSGSPIVVITGTHAADFSVITQPAVTTLAPGANTTFTLRFDPSSSGTRTALVSIANSANDFEFTISGVGTVLDPTPQSLFLPSKTGNDSGAEGSHYELGTIFRSNVAGSITHLRVYALTSESGVHTARVWRNGDASVFGGPYTWTYGGTTGWITLDIPDLSIAADTDYTVVVSTGGGGRNYPFLNGDLASAGGNGINLTRPANAGVFATTVGARPTQTFSGSNYFRDVVFVAGGTEPPTNGPVRMTEILADNKAGLQDEDGDFSDWIELYNPTAAPIDLAGYQLIDSSATWTFPSVTLGAQQYLVVFASQKNRTTDPAHLHTNFKLSSDGEYLALRDNTGATIAEFAPAYAAQTTDYSYGRRSNGDAVYFATPTPGSANGFSFLGFVAEPAFSVNRGFYATPQTVAITTGTAGATIRYTLDGSTPTETHGAIYAAPLAVSATTTVRARAFKDDFLSTPVNTSTYLFLNDVIQQTESTAVAYGWPAGPVNGQQFRHGLKPTLKSQHTDAQMLAALQQIPSMSIVTDQGNLTEPGSGIYVNPGGDGRAWERPVSLELINPDGSTGFQEDCGLRIRGGQSRSTSFPKHSFHVNFRSEYGAGKLKFPLFGTDGAAEHDTFDLRCEHGYAYADPAAGTYGTEFTAMRDVFCRDLSGASGYATTRSRYYHLYLNGQYWGLYQTQERPQEDYGATYFGGAKEEYDVIKATGLPQLTIENSEGTYEAWTQLWNGCRAVAASPTPANYFALLGKNADGTANATLPVLVSPRELAGYMLLHYYCGHSDEPLSVSFNFEKPNNFRAIRRRGMTEPFHFFVHDAESSMYAPEWVNNRANAVNLTTANRNIFDFSNPEWMHEDLLASDEYRIAFADEAQRLLFNGGAFTAAKSQPYWDARESQINQAVIGESIRWGSAASHNQTNWAAKIAQVRSQFFASRTATVVTQLRQRNLFPSVNAPTFSLRSGQVATNYALTLTAPGQTGSIYYTTNGSDPRAIGGGVAGTLYSASIAITTQTTVKARFRASGGEWSALDEAAFTTTPLATAANLVVTKIHYNPGGPSSAEIASGYTDNNDFEYIELQNIGSAAIDVSGVKVTLGVTFDFATSPVSTLAASARTVLIKRSETFAARFGGSALVAGVYAGSLSNSGEALRIIDSTGADLANFSFDDEGLWVKPPDGFGPALVLKATHLNPALASSWRSSYSTDGVPGGVDALTIADWRTQTFTAADLANPSKEATVWGNLADPDGDTVPNLIEFALGSDAKQALNRPQPTSELFTNTGDNQHHLRLTYRVREGITGVSVIPQAGNDLAAWSNSISIISGPISQGDGTLLITVQDPISQETAPTGRRFLHLQVTQP